MTAHPIDAAEPPAYEPARQSQRVGVGAPPYFAGEFVVLLTVRSTERPAWSVAGAGESDGAGAFSQVSGPGRGDAEDLADGALRVEDAVAAGDLEDHRRAGGCRPSATSGR